MTKRRRLLSLVAVVLASVRASEVVACNNYDTMFAFEYFD